MSVSSIMADSHASQLHLLVLHQLYKPHISGMDSDFMANLMIYSVNI